jgi:hypothetical protein
LRFPEITDAPGSRLAPLGSLPQTFPGEAPLVASAPLGRRRGFRLTEDWQWQFSTGQVKYLPFIFMGAVAGFKITLIYV